MSNLNFKYGLANNLPDTISEGTIYVTTDERAMYIDLPVKGQNNSVSTQRIRLGDFRIYQNITALRAAAPDWSPTTLVYLIDEDLFARYDVTTIDDPDHPGQTIEQKIWKPVNSQQDLITQIGQLNTAVAGINQDISAFETSYTANQQQIATTIAGIQNAISELQGNESSGGSGETLSLASLNAKIENLYTPADTTNGTAASGLVATNITNIAANATAIATETARAEAAEDQLAGQISQLGGSLSTLSQSTASDIGALESAVAAIYTPADTTNGTAASGLVATNITNIAANATAIATETARAEAAETQLGGQISSLSSSLTTLSQNTASAIGTLESTIEAELQAADAMTFKDIVNSTKPLPTTITGENAVQAGDTYKVAEMGTYAGVNAKVGDLFIALTDSANLPDGTASYPTSQWVHISSGYEDDYLQKFYATGSALYLTNGVNNDSSAVSTYASNITFNSESGISVNYSTLNNAVTATINLTWSSFDPVEQSSGN